MANPRAKILIIDDDSFLREMYRKFFEKAGCIVYELPEATGNIVARVLGFQPTLILIDLIMPGRYGWDAIQIIKKDWQTKSIPIFAVSNQSDVASAKKAIENGAVDHLMLAAFQPNELVDKILGYLRNPSAYEQVAQRLASWDVEDVLKSFENQIAKPEEEK